MALTAFNFVAGQAVGAEDSEQKRATIDNLISILET
jgi:hypothetical protein